MSQVIKVCNMKNLNYTQKTVRERQINEYLIATYGEDYFTLEDWLNMCYCDDGTVWIGNVEFKTPYKLD